VELFSKSLEEGQVTVDSEGRIWWTPAADRPPQLLADYDSLCGAGIFQTGPDDPFRDCCTWHDRAYQMREFFEDRGWDRKRIDLYFLDLMNNIAKGDMLLFNRANVYYSFVRMFGWVFYYKHKGSTVARLTRVGNDDCSDMMQYILGGEENGSSKEEGSPEEGSEDGNEGREGRDEGEER